jgi:glycerol-3-phosphate acyltransferase PlsY
LRISGPWLAAAVLVVEAAKGYGAVLMGDTISNDLGAVAAGLGAVAGNVYNVWYRFQGGKGLGISSGVLAGLWPVILLPVLGVMVIGVVVTRSSGIASLAAIAALILMSLVWPSLGWPTAGIESVSLLPVLATGIGLVIVWKHWRDTPFSSHARR